MKNYIKGICLLIFSTICLNAVNYRITNYVGNVITDVIKNDTIKGTPRQVVATMYHPVSSQCDSDPLLTAGMYKIPENASEQKWIAMSRNMIARWGGEFKYGDYVQIKGAGHKDGVYRVVDTMNKRFTNKIDFLESKGTKPYKFNNVTIAKITWKTQQEQVLASI